MIPHFSDDHLTVYIGDCRAVMAEMPGESVHCVVTSPPYWGLRDYGTATWEGGDAECDHKNENRHQAQGHNSAALGRTIFAEGANRNENFPGICGKCGARRIDAQLGLEPTPEEYVAAMVAVFREVRRVLRDDGTVWLNLGDSYAGGGGFSPNAPSGETSKSGKYGGIGGLKQGGVPVTAGLKQKDLVGIPWRVALALQADGWYLRSDVIWAKPNPMPESVTDRPTKSHEYVFLLSKRPTYYFDADAVREANVSPEQAEHNRRYAKPYAVYDDRAAETGQPGNVNNVGIHARGASGGRNLRSVWTIATQPYPGAHFAVFPERLVEPCIKAGTSERGACPECGAPWVRVTRRNDPPSVDPSSLDRFGTGDAGVHRKVGGQYQKWLDANPTETTGWRPSCGCGTGLLPDDLSIIETPTGERIAEDPSFIVGRAGYSRPRGQNEGTRPMMRYEQRAYARQVRGSEHRGEMESEAGSAFAHYIRTDYPNGARPIPDNLLDSWIGRGWLVRVSVPQGEPPEPVPCVVLDPFAGSGTVGRVANRFSRRATLIDLSAEYIDQAMLRNAQAPLGLSE